MRLSIVLAIVALATLPVAPDEADADAPRRAAPAATRTRRGRSLRSPADDQSSDGDVA